MNKRFLQSVVFGASGQASGPFQEAQSNQETHDLPAIVALPQPLVGFLQKAHLGDTDLSDFNTWFRDFKVALDRQAQVLLHRAEERCIDDAKASSLALEKAVLESRWSEATESAFLCFRSLAHFEVLREKNRQSKLPGVNQFLIAALSFLEGRLNGDLVSAHLDFAIADIDQLVDLYKMGEDVLPDVVKQAFLRGIDKASVGVSLLREWDQSSAEDLRQAIAHLTDGTLLLTTLRDWKDDSDLANSGSVPFVGESVQTMLDQLSSSGAIRDKTLLRWESQDLLYLEAFWLQCRLSVLVKYPYRQQIIHEMDQTLERLQGLRTLDPNLQRTTLQTLDDLFGRLQRYRIDLKNRTLGPRRWKADLLLAVSVGGVPDFFLANTIEDLIGSGDIEMAEALQDYRTTGDGAGVVRLLEQVL